MHVLVGIGGPSKQQRVVLMRRNTVVGGKYALTSALLVIYHSPLQGSNNMRKKIRNIHIENTKPTVSEETLT